MAFFRHIKALDAGADTPPSLEEEQTVDEPVEECSADSESDEVTATSEEKPKKKRFETSKMIVWICLINGFLWVWCSYILAWSGRDQIAESLSQVAVTEIIGVVLAHCVKSAVENLSKNNNWPDKPSKSDDDSSAVG
jgi:hypothetical protein